jgi:hypothetical protein
VVQAFPMTHDNPQLQKTALVVGCSDSPMTSVVSKVLSSWKLECARDNEEALALVERSAFISGGGTASLGSQVCG